MSEREEHFAFHVDYAYCICAGRVHNTPTTHLLYISVARDPSRRDVSRPPGERISDSTFGETGRGGVSSSVVRVFDLRENTSTSYMYHRMYSVLYVMTHEENPSSYVAVFTFLLTIHAIVTEYEHVAK